MILCCFFVFDRMYQHKLASLNKQLEELKNLSHPEYLKRLKKLEYQYKERLRLNEIYRDYLKECVERDYILEKKAAQKEYDEKKVSLESCIHEFCVYFVEEGYVCAKIENNVA